MSKIRTFFLLVNASTLRLASLRLLIPAALLIVMNGMTPVKAGESGSGLKAFPGDISFLSCVAGGFGEALIALEPPPDLRAWAIANVVRDAYAVVSLKAAMIEPEDAEAAKQLRLSATRSLRLAKQSGWEQLQSVGPVELMSSDMIALSFWTAAAWGALISLDRDDLEALADWPKAKALADRVRRMSPDFGEGAALALAASFEWSSPGGKAVLARQWFAEAIDRFGAKQSMLHVSVAELLDVSDGNRQKFEDRLRLAIAIADAHPGFENRLAAYKAHWLLSQSDLLF